MNPKKFLLIILLFNCLLSWSQGFKVKDFHIALSDLSASTHSRLDGNSLPCGLVKVQTKVTGVSFSGAVEGVVDNKMNEYWVYLSKGTKEFVIIRPNYLPMTIMLSDFDIDCIDSKKTYLLTLQEDNLNEEKCAVVIHIKPYFAKVCIDGVELETQSDGNYRILLPKGDHFCSFSAEGYTPVSNQIRSGKGLQTISTQLESNLAEFNINTQAGNTEVFIDDVFKGVGGWKGSLSPGRHRLEIKQPGCISTLKTINVAPKENRTIKIPSLQPIKTSLNIKSYPEGCKVFLDGANYGVSPCVIPDLVYGEHIIRLEIDTCGLRCEKDFPVIIKSDSTQYVNCELLEPAKFSLHRDAQRWFEEILKFDYRPGHLEAEKMRPYMDKILPIMDDLDMSFFLQRYYWWGTGIRQSEIYSYLMYSVYQDTHDDEKLRKIVDWHNRYADKGYYWAQWIMAHHYWCLNDFPSAIKWYEKMSGIDGSKSFEKIGSLYYELKDYIKAIKWFKKAAEFDDDEGMWAAGRLGDMYRDGVGTKKNEAEAIKYYRKAGVTDIESRLNE